MDHRNSANRIQCFRGWYIYLHASNRQRGVRRIGDRLADFMEKPEIFFSYTSQFITACISCRGGNITCLSDPGNERFHERFRKGNDSLSSDRLHPTHLVRGDQKPREYTRLAGKQSIYCLNNGCHVRPGPNIIRESPA